MHRFVLVHGGTFGSWAWSGLREELAALGHGCWAPDLPIEDVSAGIAQYLEIVEPEIAAAGPEAILVGHSMGGRVIAYAALQSRVAGLIYLAATVPGTTEQDAAEVRGNLTDEVKERLRRDELGRLYYDPETARDVFFHDCAPDVAAQAIQRLRPQATLPIEQTRTLPKLPAVPSRYIVCTEDRALRPDYGRGVARDLLGVEPVELEASHSPFLSRPADLAHLLSELADDMRGGKNGTQSRFA